LVSKGHGIACPALVSKVSASEFGDPDGLAESAGNTVDIGDHVVGGPSVPMDAVEIGLLTVTKLVRPVSQPLDTVGGGSDGWRTETISFVAEWQQILSPVAGTSSGVHLGLALLIDLVHAEGDTIVDSAIDDIIGELRFFPESPHHGGEFKTSGERGIGRPRRPVVINARLASDGIGNPVSSETGSPSETPLSTAIKVGGRDADATGGAAGVAASVATGIATAVVVVVVVVTAGGNGS